VTCQEQRFCLELRSLGNTTYRERFADSLKSAGRGRACRDRLAVLTPVAAPQAGKLSGLQLLPAESLRLRSQGEGDGLASCGPPLPGRPAVWADGRDRASRTRNPGQGLLRRCLGTRNACIALWTARSAVAAATARPARGVCSFIAFARCRRSQAELQQWPTCRMEKPLR